MDTGAKETGPTEELPPSRLLVPVNAHFTDNGRRGRYGVACLRSLAAHAGVGFVENSPDEDVDAIDVTLKFGRASAEIQVKSTSKFKVGTGPATLQLEPEWVEKWTENYNPVFVVLVKVPVTISDWIDSKPSTTTHRAAVFGKRFDPTTHTESMKFTRADLMTTETLYDWRDEVYDFYETGMGGAA